MALTAQDAATLASLQSAYDKLISGQSVASVQEGQSRTQWAAGDADKLKARIDALNASAASPTGRARGALSFRVGSRGIF